MKRSQINALIEDAKRFFAAQHFFLPPFAAWPPERWASEAAATAEVRATRLGWDLTDFGGGDFNAMGLLLFTLRNGSLAQAHSSKTYAEKVMIVREGQVTPFHFHWRKTEDIINRGGGELLVEVYASTPQAEFGSEAVSLRVDGIPRTVAPGGEIVLKPGESVTLAPGIYHQFQGRSGTGTVLVGEVSSLNDDQSDNRFHAPIGRFPAIEEDAPPLHLLCGDYS